MPVISVDNLRKSYNGTAAVDGISFSVERGEVFGLLGPNGAGKTTTVEIVEGLREADSGAVSVLDFDVRSQRRDLKERIGVQLQKNALYPNLTVRETLDPFAGFFRNSQPSIGIIERLGLSDKADSVVKTLSGGQAQRLSVGLALVNDPDLVFLDEPTTGLDPQARRGLWDVVEEMKRSGKTVLLTTHYMEEAERLCDRLVVVDHGKIIAEGSPRNLVDEHFKERAIEFEVRAELSADELGALPDVTRQQQQNGQMTLYSTNPHQTLRALLELGTQRGVELAEIHIRRATLEDVFLKLTGRRIRE